MVLSGFVCVCSLQYFLRKYCKQRVNFLHHLFKIYDYCVGEFKTNFMEFIMKKAIFVLFSLLFASSVFAGQCDYSYQQDKSGNSCGERSKYNDYGTQRTKDPFDTTGRNKDNYQERNNPYR